MRLRDVTGLLLIVTPIWFTVWFAVLARRFDYPDILRRPTDEILTRFREGGPSLIWTWWAFAISGGLLILVAALLSLGLAFRAPVIARLALVAGVLAGLVQVLGLLRWVYLVPSLARTHGDPETSEATRAATEVTFQAFHRYLGTGVGEHLGYALTGTWSVLIGLGLLRGDLLADWLGWVGLATGIALVVCSFEFLGSNEERGWGPVGRAIPVVYVVWSLWLMALGIALLV